MEVNPNIYFVWPKMHLADGALNCNVHKVCFREVAKLLSGHLQVVAKIH